jgi:hypothetical protein
MKLTSGWLDWTPPRTWFVTARLLEVAAAVTVAGSAFQTWQVFQSTTQNFGPNGEISPDGPPFLDRVTLFAMYGFGFGQVPIGALVSCLLLLLGVLAVLHFAQPVSHASLLRWEGFAIWSAVLLLTLSFVSSTAVGLIRGDPNAPQDDGTITFDPGPGTTEVLLVGLAQPVVCLLLLGVVAIWWLRLPEEFDEPEDEPVREPHRWRPAPAQDANIDDLTLDGVELIEPVERLQPRDGSSSGDGSTASGYDDYFRRF